MPEDQKFVTKHDLQDAEKRLKMMVDTKVNTIMQDQDSNYQSLIKKMEELRIDLNPVLKIYNNAGDFSRWVKAILTFLILVGVFLYTFKNLITSLIGKIN